jgi:hypothetical protein
MKNRLPQSELKQPHTYINWSKLNNADILMQYRKAVDTILSIDKAIKPPGVPCPIKLSTAIMIAVKTLLEEPKEDDISEACTHMKYFLILECAQMKYLLHKSKHASLITWNNQMLSNVHPFFFHLFKNHHTHLILTHELDLEKQEKRKQHAFGLHLSTALLKNDILLEEPLTKKLAIIETEPILVDDYSKSLWGFATLACHYHPEPTKTRGAPASINSSSPTGCTLPSM